PASLVEATLEGNLVGVLRAGKPEGETQLVHRRRTVRTKLVPGPQPGETLMFLTDLSELRRLERVRQEFVANLVHELKTPITSLRLTAESLLGDPPARERARFADRLVRQADTSSRIIDNLRQPAEGGLRIGVRDHGPGISPEHWQRVFERFYKVDPARPREAGGFGLGLAITKHLVQALGGRVWTEAADDGGQVFLIELPAAP